MTTDIDILEALFGGPGRTAVLRLLAAQTSDLTGRQIAELAGLSQPGAAGALNHLAGLGVVQRRRAGRAILHQLDRENLLVQSIVLPALAAEAHLIEDLQSELRTAFGPLAESLVLFGSVARGESAPGSDIDVLVVTADNDDATRAMQVADREGPRFFRRYGMPLSVIVTARDRLPAEPGAFLARARDEGILVSGIGLSTLMPHGSAE
ncbi:MAG: nucleotidyltransferase domain-containing protein [Coriobacteriia bacterium]|nr:nucleotidyltransferase domain-containing protein [Coriobacteriia bacterium]